MEQLPPHHIKKQKKNYEYEHSSLELVVTPLPIVKLSLASVAAYFSQINSADMDFIVNFYHTHPLGSEDFKP